MTDIIILSLLLEGPKHGYRLKQDAAMFASQQQLHNNTVYPLLSRFLKNGWITQRETEGERGQTRLLYELTDAGRGALVEKLNDFSETDVVNDSAFQLRVGLFSQLEAKDRERILRLRDECLQQRLERMARIGNARELTGWPKETFDYVANKAERERQWIAQLMTKVHED
jgi:DNA-binding PadR family transcriptional regulator